MNIGIDIGGSHIGTGIIINKGNLIGTEKRDIDLKKINKNIKEREKIAQEEIIKIIDEEIQTLLKQHKYSKEDISNIGIAVPGNPSETSIRNFVNLYIKEFEIVEILKDKYKCPIKIKNDGKCAGLAEKKYGALKEYEDGIFLCIGTGVGGAAFLNGKLLEATRAPGFEIGHMIIERDGKQCNCGKNGCFETYASMKRFKERAIKELELDENIQSEEVQNYIRQLINSIEESETKQKAIKLVNEYLENIAIGVSNIINILEPQAVCFGGSFSYYEDIFLPILNEQIKKYTYNKELEYKLLPAKLKNNAGIIGAVEQFYM